MSRRFPVVLTIVLVLLTLTAGTALAQTGPTKRVGLVVTFADGSSHTEVVTVPAGATTVDVLRAARLTIATTETQFGPALCKVNTTGCPAEDCFCDAEHFWAYYHLAGGAWASAMESIGVYVPTDRSVEGFAWSGFDAQFNPTVKPPVYTFDQLVAAQTPPVAVPEPATLLLLGGGIAALAGYARRRRGRTQAAGE